MQQSYTSTGRKMQNVHRQNVVLVMFMPAVCVDSAQFKLWKLCEK